MALSKIFRVIGMIDRTGHLIAGSPQPGAVSQAEVTAPPNELLCPNPQCGVANRVNAKICRSCGKPLSETRNGRRNHRPLFAVIAISIAACALIYFRGEHEGSKLRQQLDSQKEEIAILRVEVQQTKDEPEAVRLGKALSAKESELSAASVKIQSLTDEKQKLDSALALAKSESAQVPKLQGEIEKRDAEIQTRTAAQRDAQKQIEQLKDSLDKAREDLRFAKSDLEDRRKQLDQAASVIQDKQANKKLYRDNWNKLNGWLAANRAIRPNDVLDVLGPPDRIDASENCGQKDGTIGDEWNYFIDGKSWGGGFVCFSARGHVTNIRPPSDLR